MTSAKLRGLLVAAGGAALFSFDGLLIRLQALSPGGVLFWRSLFSALAFAVTAALVRNRIQPNPDPWLRDWRPVALMAGLLVVGNAMFVLALTHTGVANTLVIVASAPIATGILGHFMLREHLPARTWLAGLVALAGTLIVVGGSLGSGYLQGNLWAVANTAVTSLFLIVLRRYPNANRLAMLSAGAFAGAVLTAPWARPLPDLTTAIAAGVDGLVMLPGGLILITLAPRYLPAAEVGLLLLLETILGPLWVLLALRETPTLEVVLSAAIILGAIAIHSWVELREQRRAVRPP